VRAIGIILVNEIEHRRQMEENSEKSTRTKIFQNTFILISGRMVGILIAAGTSIFFARYLGSQRFGQFSSLYAYLSLFTWLASLGIEPILTREVARRRGDAGIIVATGMVLCSFFAVLTSGVAIFLAPFSGYSESMQRLVVFAAVDMLLLFPLRLPAIIFQADMKQWYVVFINVARQVFWFGAIVALAKIGASLPAFVLMRLAGAVLETILILWYSAKFIAPPYFIDLDRLIFYLKACVPLAFSSLLASIYLRIDQVMLHNLASDRVLGDYAVAVKVSELFEMLPAALLSALFPVLATYVNDKTRSQAFTDRVFRYMMITAGLLCVAMCVGSKIVMSLLYGPEFSQSAKLLSILVWSEFAVFFGAVVIHVLLARNCQRFLIFPTAIGAGLNVFLNIVFIPRYAASGSAWASVLSYGFAWMFFLLIFKRTRGVIWQGLRRAIPVILISLASSIGALLLPLPTALRFVLALAAYTGGIWWIRAADKEDVTFIMAAVNRGLLKFS
jgi:O-antigen/teichoic acid export membrane protein